MLGPFRPQPPIPRTHMPKRSMPGSSLNFKSITCLVLMAIVMLTGCATKPPVQTAPLATGQPDLSLSSDMEDRILAIDPEQITQNDVKEILSKGPAPRIVNIHGGIYPVHLVMESFSRFLIGMGYPESSIRNPGDDSYSFSCYDSSERIAGVIAWYYEKDGMRPMIVGHSQGGVQAVKVLHVLAGNFDPTVAVWNPLTNKAEARYEIRDPLTGKPIPVAEMQVAYATAVGAGGLTRILPNQWSMMKKLRRIPDSVIDFTGFYMGLDLFGGDMMGFGKANQFEPTGTAHVRNVRLRTGTNHFNTPSTQQLLDQPEAIEWIYNYVPTDELTLDGGFGSDDSHVQWAADVWYSIKKHWVLELQRAIQAQRGQTYAN